MEYLCEAADRVGKHACKKPARMVIVSGKLLETLATLCNEHIQQLAGDGYSIRDVVIGDA